MDNNSNTNSTGLYIGKKPTAPKTTSVNSGAKIEVQPTNQPSTPAPRPYAYE
jgi:hypothetical protein